MDRTTIAMLAAGAVAATAVLRQRSEAAKVRGGQLAKLGPTGQPDVLPDDDLHRTIASWRPTPPRHPLLRGLVALWSGPLTLVGLAVGALGGAAPRIDRERDCLVTRDVGGLPGRFLRGQGADAATIGRVVVSASAAPSPSLLDHEAVHVRQQERLGPLFALAYPVAQARWGYRANPFEVAARAGAAEVSRPR